MSEDALATTLDRIRVFPIKSLDGVDVDAAALAPGGGLSRDREFALVDADGDYVNGKNERRIHRVSAEFDLDARIVSLAAPHDVDAPAPATFDLDDPDEREGIASWVGAFLGDEVDLIGERAGGYPDDTELTGPTVVSRGTLREVASWFDCVGVDSMRRRLRANVELASEEPFVEDRLVAEPDERVRFRVGGAELLGVNPCQRCVVPSRDPDTGAEFDDFRTRFVRKREETMPDWSGGARFDHAFRLMVNTAVPDGSVGGTLRLGDDVRSLGTEPE
ncbi:MOSC domain-containing protein [Halobaculum rubrum]|uniref:MOSC domain-containing protein n=1 Tax=Halobaculum rubrum TaxID=2872158 RepID=UPI001CA44739|nr:MOSC N-terminal beta barrel domain-containing protein [Halobaculum rubrum]QZX99014.1 MOSC N-terminal beta barrel domain-containing protein [Halobaculum rubrum]